jgi:hypothetical protein
LPNAKRLVDRACTIFRELIYFFVPSRIQALTFASSRARVRCPLQPTRLGAESCLSKEGKMAISENTSKKETHMRISTSTLRGRLVPLISLLLLFAFLNVRPSVAASSEEEIRVLANLPLKGMHVNQMFTQQVENKFYLYLHRPVEDVYALVDVTKPDKPTLVNPNALKGTTPEGAVGPSPVAITATQEGGASQAGGELPAQTVNLVDTSDPKNPKPIKTFKGVTSMYADSARKLVYLVNGDGLWIVSHRHSVPLCGGVTCALGGP